MSKDAKVGFLVLMLAVSVYLLNSLRASGVVSFGNELGLTAMIGTIGGG